MTRKIHFHRQPQQEIYWQAVREAHEHFTINNKIMNLNEIENTKPDNRGDYYSKDRQIFEIICEKLGNPKIDWISRKNEGRLKVYLSIAFYDRKKEVIALLKSLDYEEPISFIEGFEMPYDYSEDRLIQLLKRPHSCQNGSYLGVNRFFIESCLQSSDFHKNLPYDLITKNKRLANPKVFEALESAVKESYYSENCYYLALKMGVLTEKQTKILQDSIDKKHLGNVNHIFKKYDYFASHEDGYHCVNNGFLFKSVK